MQQLLELRSAVPVQQPELPMQTLHEAASPASSNVWSQGLRAVVAVGLAPLVAACMGGGDNKNKADKPLTLETAPHGTTLVLPAGTFGVFEELEAPDGCAKPASLGFVEAAPTPTGGRNQGTSAPTPSRTRQSASKGAALPCEGAELEFEACITGKTPDTNPDTVAAGCSQFDMTPANFIAATGLLTMPGVGERVEFKFPATGVVDKD